MAFTVLVLHLLGASVWVGGHLVLLFGVLPGALKAHDPSIILTFEKRYERIGIPALLLQVVSGLWLAHRYVPGILDAFDFSDRLHSIVAWKLILLGATVVIGAHARLRIIPRLTPERLPLMAVHVAFITTIAVAMLIVGAAVRAF